MKSSLKVIHEAIRIFSQGVALTASVKYPEQHLLKATLEYFSDLTQLANNKSYKYTFQITMPEVKYAAPL